MLTIYNGDSVLGEQANFLFDEAGKFPVVLVVKNNWTCADTIIKVVNVEEDFALYVPNTFTPNDDGINDVFRPVGMGLKNYSIEIYDRWGVTVFATNDFQQGWDGHFRSEICPQAVYTWKIIYTSSGGRYDNRTGFVFLEH